MQELNLSFELLLTTYFYCSFVLDGLSVPMALRSVFVDSSVLLNIIVVYNLVSFGNLVSDEDTYLSVSGEDYIR